MSAAVASTAAVNAAAIAQAISAAGVLVRMEPHEFVKLLERKAEPLIVQSTGGFFRKHHRYLMSYRGLAFFTKSPTPLELPPDAEVVMAASIWTPG